MFLSPIHKDDARNVKKSVQPKRTKKIHPFENNEKYWCSLKQHKESHCMVWCNFPGFFAICGFRSFLRIDIVCTAVDPVRYRHAHQISVCKQFVFCLTLWWIKAKRAKDCRSWFDLIWKEKIWTAGTNSFVPTPVPSASTITRQTLRNFQPHGLYASFNP